MNNNNELIELEEEIYIKMLDTRVQILEYLEFLGKIDLSTLDKQTAIELTQKKLLLQGTLDSIEDALSLYSAKTDEQPNL